MDKDERELAFQYSWGWFKYHAQQRYSAFNYFLLTIGALSWAYMQKPEIINNDLNLMRTAIGLLGFFISLAFLFIEKRNTELVNDGRAGLDKLEDINNGANPFKEYHIRRLDKENRKNKLLCHHFWFRFVILVALITACASVLYPL
ncbi:hypothetical protein HZC35_01450 [Candidatus Saganbacteria bacterium]|nr:hypothetical protein [Candidatus Saganbacteria bacterium]